MDLNISTASAGRVATCDEREILQSLSPRSHGQQWRNLIPSRNKVADMSWMSAAIEPRPCPPSGNSGPAEMEGVLTGAIML